MNKSKFEISFHSSVSEDEVRKLICDNIDLNKFSIKKTESKRQFVKEYDLNHLFEMLGVVNFKIYEVEGKSYKVKINSQRYFLFRECSFCVCCGLQGNRLLLEANNDNEETAHFNLYGEKDEELILMTKDHIKPKSKGGKDNHSNYQTMCSICNSLKGHINLNLTQLIDLRKYYDSIKNESKGTIHNKLVNYKQKLLKNLKETHTNKQVENKKIGSLVTNFTLSVFRDCNDNLYCTNLYINRSNITDEYVGCIIADTSLECLIKINDNYLCKLSETQVVTVHKNLLREIK